MKIGIAFQWVVALLAHVAILTIELLVLLVSAVFTKKTFKENLGYWINSINGSLIMLRLPNFCKHNYSTFPRGLSKIDDDWFVSYPCMKCGHRKLVNSKDLEVENAD